ncbi:MAG TPA: BMP family protein [Planctomycetota bacterium]|nr:BMP family protein [Planctomycetota bacterium]
MAKALGAIALLVAILIVLLAMPKSTKAPGTGPVEAPAENAGGFSVALVTPGAVNDGGWSQNAYQGLQKIEKELGAKIYNTVAKDGSAAEAFAAFRDFAGRGTDLVIGHASEWFDPKTLEIAAANPKTTFVISGSERAQGNTAGIRFLLEDGCYVLGQIAAGMSKSGVIGCVGPEKIPVIESTFHAFTEGAKSVKKDIKVEIVWTNSWSDVARAKERTLILLGQGADFIFHNANDGAPGVFQAVQDKRKQGGEVYAFGSNADQNGMAEDVILASVVLDIPSAFVAVAKKVKEKQFKSEPQFAGMPQGLVWITYNKKLEEKIPGNVRKNADETVEKIRKGEFKVPRLELK